MFIAFKLTPRKHFNLGAESVLIQNVAFYMKNKLY